MLCVCAPAEGGDEDRRGQCTLLNLAGRKWEGGEGEKKRRGYVGGHEVCV